MFIDTINQADANTDAIQTRQLSGAFDMLIICLVPEGMWTLFIPSSLRCTLFPNHLHTSVGHLDEKATSRPQFSVMSHNSEKKLHLSWKNRKNEIEQNSDWWEENIGEVKGRPTKFQSVKKMCRNSKILFGTFWTPSPWILTTLCASEIPFLLSLHSEE